MPAKIFLGYITQQQLVTKNVKWNILCKMFILKCPVSKPPGQNTGHLSEGSKLEILKIGGIKNTCSSSLRVEIERYWGGCTKHNDFIYLVHNLSFKNFKMYYVWLKSNIHFYEKYTKYKIITFSIFPWCGSIRHGICHWNHTTYIILHPVFLF